MRMGRDKAFIAIDGVPLWRRQLQLLEDLRPHELFIAGPAHEEWQQIGCIIIPDAAPDAGPLAGIVAALQRCSAPLLLVLAVDLPIMTGCYLRELVESCAPECGVVPSRDKQHEPLAAIYPKQSLALAERRVASRDLSVQNFAARCLAEGLVVQKEITRDKRPLFLNMNTPDDLALASADASHKGHKGSQREAASSSTL